MHEQITLENFPLPHVTWELNVPRPKGRGAYPYHHKGKTERVYFDGITPNLNYHPATHGNWSGAVSGEDNIAKLLKALYSLPNDLQTVMSILDTGKHISILLKNELVSVIKQKLNKRWNHVLNYRLKELLF